MTDFALVGAAGFIAPRHLRAISQVGGGLVAAADPHDSVGVLDGFFPNARFFTEIERFDRFLNKAKRKGEAIDYLSICSPNYLHDAHVRMALRAGADAICEKPLVINPWNLDALADIESETGKRVWTVLQLRLHEAVTRLRRDVAAAGVGQHDIELTYVTRRGPWYDVSWKGDEGKSGGVLMNIGVHFFDMLVWIFGAVQTSSVHLRSPGRAAGALVLDHANVSWFLSTHAEDLPDDVVAAGRHAYRSLTIDGREVDFSAGFTDLHDRVYEAVLAGRGFGIEDARPSIDLVSQVRTATVERADGIHPLAHRHLSRSES